MVSFRLILFSGLLFLHGACRPQAPGKPNTSTPAVAENQSGSLRVGAEQLEIYLPLLKDKSVALLVNHTALIGETHLADTLLKSGVKINKIFGPEHGFRGNAADGEVVNNGVDTRTGLPVISLYGKNKKPTKEQLADVDVIIFDIQDVGTRFYTYISTLHYLMEAAAENDKHVVILDRPNPHGSYVDGPMLQPELQSFVGMHPIPVVHGLTVGELGKMINGEGWLKDENRCELTVIPMKNWTHQDDYLLPVYPSPNLPNSQAIRLYPSLCFFEGTAISVGRGTDMPFQVLGNPDLKGFPFSFTPITIKGVAVNPLHENKLCFGVDLRNAKTGKQIDLSYLIEMYHAYPDKENFFTNPFDKNYIDKLAGTTQLKEQIRNGLSEEEIRHSWQEDLDKYKSLRKKYLLYAE